MARAWCAECTDARQRACISVPNDRLPHVCVCACVRGQVLVRLGAGEIFGEISFLDTGDAGAGASVVAEDEVLAPLPDFRTPVLVPPYPSPPLVQVSACGGKQLESICC
jgi:hypothetical protein